MTTIFMTSALVRYPLTTFRLAPISSRIRYLSMKPDVEPILDTQRLQERLQTLAPSIASSLATVGYWTNQPENQDESLVSDDEVRVMRQQSIALRNEGRFEQSLSETTSNTGEITEFAKEGVFACEPDGQDYYTAPDLLLYMSTVISMLPPLLNNSFNSLSDDTTSTLLTLTQKLELSNQAFNAKLAVTSPGGSVYPLHVDNTLGVQGTPHDDTRKLTCILYLNPNHVEGGELQLVLGDNESINLTPEGGRVVIFWSDEIPHQVLPCAPLQEKTNDKYDRYALTVWIPDMDPRNIKPPGSKFQDLREGAFA